MRKFLVNYLERHQHPLNQCLHLVGVPLTFVVPVVLLGEARWGWATAAFFAGYGLQFLGHAIEGNDAGEAILVKKWLGKPYVAVVPRPEVSKSDG